MFKRTIVIAVLTLFVLSPVSAFTRAAGEDMGVSIIPVLTLEATIQDHIRTVPTQAVGTNLTRRASSGSY